ncbi:MAG: preprotein translocase subunit YajC [Elusimicrobiota bacterium]|jgi:preprotein translocase subunit YajC|nr:preprotein translocase subunit YajC [Elusimicrobiota bacterium]
MKKLELAAFVLLCAIFLPASAYAQGAGGFGGLGSLLPIILIFVFFYFFLLRPQQKKAKEHQKLLNALKRDDKVVAAGGIYGTVVNVKGNIVEIRIAEGVNIDVSKPTISAVLIDSSIAGDRGAAKIPEIIKK